jgi:uncharacterized protein (DUF433 family)
LDRLLQAAPEGTMPLTLDPPPLPLVVDDSGVIRVTGTRVPLATVITAYQQGATPEEIVDAFDTLQLADVYAVIAYFLRHRPEVDAYLSEQREQAAAIRRDVEARFPQDGIKERLLARRRA